MTRSEVSQGHWGVVIRAFQDIGCRPRTRTLEGSSTGWARPFAVDGVASLGGRDKAVQDVSTASRFSRTAQADTTGGGWDGPLLDIQADMGAWSRRQTTQRPTAEPELFWGSSGGAAWDNRTGRSMRTLPDDSRAHTSPEEEGLVVDVHIQASGHPTPSSIPGGRAHEENVSWGVHRPTPDTDNRRSTQSTHLLDSWHTQEATGAFLGWDGPMLDVQGGLWSQSTRSTNPDSPSRSPNRVLGWGGFSSSGTPSNQTRASAKPESSQHSVSSMRDWDGPLLDIQAGPFRHSPCAVGAVASAAKFPAIHRGREVSSQSTCFSDSWPAAPVAEAFPSVSYWEGPVLDLQIKSPTGNGTTAQAWGEAIGQSHAASHPEPGHQSLVPLPGWDGPLLDIQAGWLSRSPLATVPVATALMPAPGQTLLAEFSSPHCFKDLALPVGLPPESPAPSKTRSHAQDTPTKCQSPSIPAAQSCIPKPAPCQYTAQLGCFSCPACRTPFVLSVQSCDSTLQACAVQAKKEGQRAFGIQSDEGPPDVPATQHAGVQGEQSGFRVKSGKEPPDLPTTQQETLPQLPSHPPRKDIAQVTGAIHAITACPAACTPQDEHGSLSPQASTSKPSAARSRDATQPPRRASGVSCGAGKEGSWDACGPWVAPPPQKQSSHNPHHVDDGPDAFSKASDNVCGIVHGVWADGEGLRKTYTSHDGRQFQQEGSYDGFCSSDGSGGEKNVADNAYCSPVRSEVHQGETYACSSNSGLHLNQEESDDRASHMRGTWPGQEGADGANNFVGAFDSTKGGPCDGSCSEEERESRVEGDQGANPAGNGDEVLKEGLSAVEGLGSGPEPHLEGYDGACSSEMSPKSPKEEPYDKAVCSLKGTCSQKQGLPGPQSPAIGANSDKEEAEAAHSCANGDVSDKEEGDGAHSFVNGENCDKEEGDGGHGFTDCKHPGDDKTTIDQCSSPQPRPEDAMEGCEIAMDDGGSEDEAHWEGDQHVTQPQPRHRRPRPITHPGVAVRLIANALQRSDVLKQKAIKEHRIIMNAVAAGWASGREEWGPSTSCPP